MAPAGGIRALRVLAVVGFVVVRLIFTSLKFGTRTVQKKGNIRKLFVKTG